MTVQWSIPPQAPQSLFKCGLEAKPLIWVSADQTIEKPRVLARRERPPERLWAAVSQVKAGASQTRGFHSYCRKINTGKSNICHSQLIGGWCTASRMIRAVMYAGSATESAFDPDSQSDPAFAYKVGVLRIYCGFLCGSTLIWTHV